MLANQARTFSRLGFAMNLGPVALEVLWRRRFSFQARKRFLTRGRMPNGERRRWYLTLGRVYIGVELYRKGY